MSALSAFRAAITSGKSVSLEDDNGSAVDDISQAHTIVLGDSRFPKETRTEFIGDNDEPYSLGAIFFAYQKRNIAKHAEYFQECIRCGLKPVSLLQKKDLFGYLEGTRDLASIQPHAAISKDEMKDDLDHQRSKRAKLDGAAAHQERVIQDRVTILSAIVPKSFEGIQKLALDLFLKAPKSTQDEKERRSGPKQPIIIVPSALTSLITLYNAHLFLEKGVFKSTEEVRRTSPAKEAEIKLTHKFKSGKSITFRVLDSPNALSGSDWDNVVAVFASGHIWQFKGWKWEEPVDIFNHVKGFYVKYSDAAADQSIRKWNVSLLEVNRYKRHLDGQCVYQFWTMLESWLVKNRPMLME